MMKIKNYLKDKNTIFGIFAIIFYFLIMNVFTNFISGIIYSTLDYNYILNNSNFINSLYQIAVYIILFVPLVLFLKDDLKTDLFDLKKDRSKSLMNFFIGYVIFFCFNILASILTMIFKIETSENQNQIVDMAKSSGFGLFAILLSAVLLGPLTEELIFRKAFFKVFKNNYVSLIISSFVFGLIHILSTDGTFKEQLIVGIPYFASGLGFGLAYIKSDRNILIPTAIHMVSNFISIIAIFIS